MPVAWRVAVDAAFKDTEGNLCGMLQPLGGGVPSDVTLMECVINLS